MAITREDVLHVAALARLELTEDEIGRLDRTAERHPRRRRQGVRARPLGRAADVASAGGRERLPDRTSRGPSLPLDDVFANAPERDGDYFRVPPTGVAEESSRMIDTLRLTAEEAKGLLDRGEVSGAELRAAYREAIDARNDELHCFLTLVDGDENEGVPIALKDVISTKGVRTTAGSRILDELRPRVRLDGRRPLQGRGVAAAREDEHR